VHSWFRLPALPGDFTPVPAPDYAETREGPLAQLLEYLGEIAGPGPLAACHSAPTGGRTVSLNRTREAITGAQRPGGCRAERTLVARLPHEYRPSFGIGVGLSRRFNRSSAHDPDGDGQQACGRGSVAWSHAALADDVPHARECVPPCVPVVLIRLAATVSATLLRSPREGSAKRKT
jgi:hypothetical protein